MEIPNIFDLIGAKRPGGLDPAELRAFLQNARGPNNKHVNVGNYEAYLRKAGRRRNVGDNTLDFASVQRTDLPPEMGDVSPHFHDLPPEQRAPRGQFRELLAVLEQEAKGAGHDAIFAENILNKFLPRVLGSAGYQPMSGESLWPGPPSMFKRLRD